MGMGHPRMLLILTLALASLSACKLVATKDDPSQKGSDEIEGVFISLDPNYSCQLYSMNPYDREYGIRSEIRATESFVSYAEGCSDAIETLSEDEIETMVLSDDGNTLRYRGRRYKRFVFEIPSADVRLDYTLEFPGYTCTTDLEPSTTINSHVNKISFNFPTVGPHSSTEYGDECNDAHFLYTLREYLISHDGQQLRGSGGIYQLSYRQ
jgi:hypothetical protein